jgi:hypothetical protein
MPTRYRFAVVALGLFVIASAAFSLMSVARLDAAGGARAGAVLRALVAIAVGGTIAVAGYRGRAPGWLTDLFIGRRDPD